MLLGAMACSSMNDSIGSISEVLGSPISNVSGNSSSTPSGSTGLLIVAGASKDGLKAKDSSACGGGTRIGSGFTNWLSVAGAFKVGVSEKASSVCCGTKVGSKGSF